MPTYRSPIQDVLFNLYDAHDYATHFDRLTGDAPSRTEVEAILDELARFAERELAPLYLSGDAQGAQCLDGRVQSPAGFADAYRRYVEAGWPRLGHAEQWGGLETPYSVKLAASEFMQAANQSWCMYALLNDGAIKTLTAHARTEQQQTFVPKLVSGEWAGTMCLTEPQCGSDLNLLRCRAEPIGDGRYRITGTKIFISSGEQDFTDNIVHLVLARLPDAPAGTRGISLFVVPKRLPDQTERINNIRAVSIEHKMGLRGSATCTMNFDGAEGWLVGEPNRGLSCMFTFINKSRLGAAQQAYAQAEASFQTALEYVRERRAGRAAGTASDAGAAALIAHPDIRRMLLTQKALAEGGRSLVLYCARYVDLADDTDVDARNMAEQRLSLLTPIAKGAVSEWASEATDLGIQMLGGHGYVSEWGQELRSRDARVTRIYEGTTAIQALDLLERKVLGSQRAALQTFLAEIEDFAMQCPRHASLNAMRERLLEALAIWRDVTDEIAVAARQDSQLVGAVAVDYLMLAAYVTLAYMWLLAAAAALPHAERSDFHLAKIQTAAFYFDKLLPRIAMHRALIGTGSNALMQMADDHFAFI